MRAAVAAIFKNEAPYIVEWVAHHLSVGFTDFVIADNASTDGTTQILESLQAAGIIRLVPFPGEAGKGAQLPAYELLLAEHLSEFDWVAFIDADEFIKVDRSSIVELLGSMPEDAGGVILNWSTFGTSGHRGHTPGMVTERFRCRAERDFPPNRHFKSIVRPCVASVGRNPHSFKLSADMLYYRLNGRPETIKTDGTAGLTSDVDWSGGRINHYIVKSAEEFFSRKRLRGRGMIGALRPYSFFDDHNKNDVEEEADYSWYQTVHARMRAIEAKIGPLAQGRRRQKKSKGSVDRAFASDGALRLTGWALDAEGISGPSGIAVQVGSEIAPITEIRITRREDLAANGMEPFCGFELIIPILSDDFESKDIKVFVGGDSIPHDPSFSVIRGPK